MKTDTQFNIRKEDDVSVDFYSELMNNYFPESSIKAGQDIRSLMVAPEKPMLFYLDQDDKLQALLRVEGSEAGWINLPLSKGAVKSFEIEYNTEEDHLQIAKVEDNEVRISQELPLSSTPFETLDKDIKWQSLKANGEEVIDKVSIGTEHVLFATSEKGKDAVYYLARLDDMAPERYTFPEHSKHVIQFELGNFLYTTGVFFLYKIGQENGMLYQSFPDPEFDTMEQARFKEAEEINCFTLLEDGEGNDILYTAGKNVYEFSMNPDTGYYEGQVLPGTSEDISKIRAAGHDDERSVWTLDKHGLHYRTNRFFDQNKQAYTSGKWTEPLLMVKGADQFSCLKGKGVRNQLFSISTSEGSELTRLWQDDVTTLWNQHKICISSLDSLKEVESYSAHIRFKAKTSTRTFAGQKVRLSADSNLFVYINSQSYHLGPDHEVSIELGVVPEFTVICPINDIAASRIFLSADFLKQDQAINLAEKVLERLENKASSGDALAKAERPNGKLLVPEGTDPETLQGAADGIKEMLSAARDMENESPGKLKSASFAINASGNASPASAGFSGALASQGFTLGDFLHSIWQTAKKAVEFIVEKVTDGIRFVIKIGEEIFNWVVKTLREIGSFVQKIFESIKVFFEDLFEFLAFLFDWQSILDTKNAFKDFTNAAILSLEDGIGDIKAYLDKELNAAISNFSPELVNLPDSVSAMGVDEGQKETQADPRSNWLNSKKDIVNEGKQKTLNERIPTEFSGVLEKFIQDVTPILEELGQGFLSQLEILGDGFKQVINGQMSFGDFLKLLVQKLAGFGLFLAKQLIDILLTSLVALLEVAQAGLNKPWDIPLISALYKEITNGSELSFIDVVCLFIAIPTTVLYKIGEGKAPFGDNKSREEFIQSGRTAFQLKLA